MSDFPPDPYYDPDMREHEVDDWPDPDHGREDHPQIRHQLQSEHYDDYGPEENDWEHQRTNDLICSKQRYNEHRPVARTHNHIENQRLFLEHIGNLERHPFCGCLANCCLSEPNASIADSCDHPLIHPVSSTQSEFPP